MVAAKCPRAHATLAALRSRRLRASRVPPSSRRDAPESWLPAYHHDPAWLHGSAVMATARGRGRPHERAQAHDHAGRSVMIRRGLLVVGILLGVGLIVL